MAPIKPGKRNNIRARANKSLDPRGKYAPPVHPVDEDVSESTPAFTSTATPAQRESQRPHEMKDAEWRLNKQDKRAIKHNALLNKVREAGVLKQKKVLKRRRPGRKLKGGDMGSLADALPDDVDDDEMEVEDDDDDDDDAGEEWEGVEEVKEGEMGTTTVAKKARRKRRKVPVGGRMEMKSLSMRQGAMRRKAEMEGREKERFGKNLAKMVEGVGVGVGVGVGSGSGGGGKEGVENNNGQAGRWAALRAFIGGTMQTNVAFNKV